MKTLLSKQQKHKNCGREMKVAKCSENGSGEIFVTGEHTHDDNLDDGGVDVPSVDLGAENEVDGAE